MSMTMYSDEEILQQLKDMHDWTLNNAAIEKTFLFKNFNQALGFIVRIGLLAEQADHHPEIFNVYNKVVIRLNTHSVKGITSKDIELAKSIDALLIN